VIIIFSVFYAGDFLLLDRNMGGRIPDLPAAFSFPSFGMEGGYLYGGLVKTLKLTFSTEEKYLSLFSIYSSGIPDTRDTLSLSYFSVYDLVVTAGIKKKNLFFLFRGIYRNLYTDRAWGGVVDAGWMGEKHGFFYGVAIKSLSPVPLIWKERLEWIYPSLFAFFGVEKETWWGVGGGRLDEGGMDGFFHAGYTGWETFSLSGYLGYDRLSIRLGFERGKLFLFYTLSLSLELLPEHHTGFYWRL